MDYSTIYPFLLDAIIFIIGLIVGSFLNVLALRSLNDESIFWPPSYCRECKHDIPIQDNIPLLSFILLKGKCRFCQKAISLQYPTLEILTAFSFVFLVNYFGFNWQALAMTFFVSTLFVVSITDFRAKIIPHDITYPSILIGITFSIFLRNDLLGTLAGIGASYIIFDFIAHYGLKLYIMYHPELQSSESEEDIEVMGGGDAVLSAVIAAYLGWQCLAFALLVGFIAGAIIGLFFLTKEMQKSNLLQAATKKIITGAIIGFIMLAAPSLLLISVTKALSLTTPLLLFSSLGAIGGGVLGLVSSSSTASKPFPFGPALALGGIVAIFFNPLSSLK